MQVNTIVQGNFQTTNSITCLGSLTVRTTGYWPALKIRNQIGNSIATLAIDAYANFVTDNNGHNVLIAGNLNVNGNYYQNGSLLTFGNGTGPQGPKSDKGDLGPAGGGLGYTLPSVITADEFIAPFYSIQEQSTGTSMDILFSRITYGNWRTIEILPNNPSIGNGGLLFLLSLVLLGMQEIFLIRLKHLMQELKQPSNP